MLLDILAQHFSNDLSVTGVPAPPTLKEEEEQACEDHEARQHGYPGHHLPCLSATDEFHSGIFGNAGDALPITGSMSMSNGLSQHALLTIPAGGATMQFWDLSGSVLLQA